MCFLNSLNTFDVFRVALSLTYHRHILRFMKMFLKPKKIHGLPLAYIAIEFMNDELIMNGENIPDINNEEVFWSCFDKLNIDVINRLAVEYHQMEQEIYFTREDIIADRPLITLMKNIYYDMNNRLGMNIGISAKIREIFLNYKIQSLQL